MQLPSVVEMFACSEDAFVPIFAMAVGIAFA